MNFDPNNTTAPALVITVHIPGLRLLVAFCCVLIYVFGYTGCFLSILTFSSRNLRHHSTGFLFLIMAFVDILNLFASLQYFLNGIYQINVYMLSVHLCRFLTIFNYELYFAFSWIFVFISVDRWIKVEWPTKSQTLCTREKFIYLCLLTLLLSLVQNIIYAFLCFDHNCEPKNLICEIFIHAIYITLYMTVPIIIILVSIFRTCLITINLRKRFRTSIPHNQQQESQQPLTDMPTAVKLETLGQCTSTTTTSRISYSFVSSHSSTATNNTNHSQFITSSNRLAHYRRRRSRMDAQMIILISINVVPFILVHIITEIAYLFEKYSAFVKQSHAAELVIILIYLSWYLISATRFYTNCLLSRIYREEFKNRLYTLRHGCKPRSTQNDRRSSRRQSSRYYIGSIGNGGESITVNLKSIGMN
ncbi:unnamed protein product [Rotaria magnacalcarata]|uniref:G-protein coupled receptors family 1 profile domain-containing protein n=1 Tax=Rotaria magnacalcarata TaxID=392030 RepID=A0A814ZNQ9_9BILA|nr:unnamed protein product [Rotaria magnacalcarata]CAF1582811.1 unnamed protein product [Rotaria magnacalcarata]CAF2264337.1 unnamed protein product [Rotaria magnacalcarata]CAF3857806.1 unnamed protein product [Rotaria magnacalcarata]CAF3960495.1 unnamed protein product [Rotaria magnacalcarata]